MSRITYMIWNVQNFGAQTRNSFAARGSDSSQFARFLGALVQQHGVDIVAIMEVLSSSLPHLQAVADQLAVATGVLWGFDWIKSCVAVLRAPLGPADLSWASGPRAEGYAVFWKASPDFQMLESDERVSEGAEGANNSPAPTDPPPAPGVKPNVLALSRWSRTADIRLTENPKVIRPVGRFDPQAPYAQGVFAQGDYPRTSNLDISSVFWTAARRPATWTIRVPPGQFLRPNLFVPMSVYHAPAYSQPSQIGTFLSGLAAELYISFPMSGRGGFAPTVIASGDYNVDVRNRHLWLESYKTYRLSLAGPDQGAGCSAANAGVAAIPPIPPASTLVRLQTEIGGPPITSPFPWDYMGGAVDNIFFRLGQGVMVVPPTEVLDLVSFVMQPRPEVFDYGDYLNTQILPNYWVDPVAGPSGPSGRLFPDILDWRGFFFEARQGWFTSARHAAEFVRVFLSDHLPVCLTLDFL